MCGQVIGHDVWVGVDVCVTVWMFQVIRQDVYVWWYMTVCFV